MQLAAHAPNPDGDTPPGTAYPGRAIAEGSAGQEVGQVERWLNRRAQLSCGEGYVPTTTALARQTPLLCGLSSSRRGCSR